MRARAREKVRGELLRPEPLAEALPVQVVVALTELRLHRERGRADHELRLEHDRHRVLEVLRLLARIRAAFERVEVGPVPRHAVVQARAAGLEVVALADVAALHEADELARDVAMKRRRPERVARDGPAVAD